MSRFELDTSRFRNTVSIERLYWIEGDERMNSEALEESGTIRALASREWSKLLHEMLKYSRTITLISSEQGSKFSDTSLFVFSGSEVKTLVAEKFSNLGIRTGYISKVNHKACNKLHY